jgi:MFS family permease
VTDPRRVALWAGVLAAVTPAVSGVLGPFFGRLADRREIAPAPTAERVAPRLRMRDVIRHPNFPVVVTLLLIAQFLDRGLALLIPLHVTQLPGVSAIAAISGTIISVAAVAATVSSNAAARLTRGVPAAQLLMLALLVGGPLCAAMALARGWPTLLVLRSLVGLCLGGAITLAYTLGAEIVPAEHRGHAGRARARLARPGGRPHRQLHGSGRARHVPGRVGFR